MSNDAARRRLFPDEFDDTFPVGAESGNIAFFGRAVLQGLVNESTTSPSPAAMGSLPFAWPGATGLGFVDRRSRTDSQDW
jgi:hypothetical protein